MLFGTKAALLCQPLRPRVLEIIHSAHQGMTGIEDCAIEIFYWPGITNDIEHTRSICKDCCRNAPSQAALPAARPEIPTRPFKAIFQDVFEEGGNHYRVAGDRLSGWVEVHVLIAQRQVHMALLLTCEACSQPLEFHCIYPVMGDLNLLPLKQKSSFFAGVSTTGVLLLIIPNQIAEQRLQRKKQRGS